MKFLILFALIGLIQGAPSADRFLPFFSGDKTAVVEPAAGTGGQVSTDPVVLNQTSGGKKITLTITKTIEKGTGGGQANVAGHHDAGHANHGHGKEGQKGQLKINLQDQSVKIDNATLQSMIEGLLGGNIQDVKITHPEMMHGKKPVAVIFSSAIHVVDLGVLEPPVKPTPAPLPALVVHNLSHPELPLLNASSIMDTLLSPLMMLSHHNPPPPPTPVQQTIPMQSMAMQPVIMMMPATTSIQQTQTPMIIQPNQLQGIMDSLIGAKVNSTLAFQNLLAAQLKPTVHSTPAQVAPVQPVVVPAASAGQGARKKISKVVTFNIEKDSRHAPEGKTTVQDASPVSTTASPVTMSASPVTMSASPVSTTESPVTMSAFPVSTTASPAPTTLLP